jgi:hypothetical protein
MQTSDLLVAEAGNQSSEGWEMVSDSVGKQVEDHVQGGFPAKPSCSQGTQEISGALGCFSCISACG